MAVQTTALTGAQASYDAAKGVITLHVPEAAVGQGGSSGRSTLYSVTAFSATSLQAQSATTLFNLIDATAPFDVLKVQ